jgi:hypothetical protein
MTDVSSVRDEDRKAYWDFCLHHLPAFSRVPAPEIWHYTTAEGLIGILKSGQILTTQIACLNDNAEKAYFGRLVHKELKNSRAANTDERLAVLWRVANDALSQMSFVAEGHFVACFSEAEDDLGQWRGYGGGECRYAIGLRHAGIPDAVKRRQTTAGSFMLPMNYDDSQHRFLVADVLRMAQTFFLAGLPRCSDIERWAREFLFTYAIPLDIFASVVKHPTFANEREHRVALHLAPGDEMNLEFRQKRTLLARHLPFDLTREIASARKLPITRVYVGPSTNQQVSRVSVGDVLRKFGYEGTPVELSKVPYRVP